MGSDSGYNVIIKRTAERLRAEGHNVHEYQVYEVVNSICRYIKELMTRGSHEGFFINSFGKFVVQTKKREALERSKSDKLKKLMDSGNSDNLKITTNV